MKYSILVIAAALSTLTGCVTSGMKHAELKAQMEALKADEGRVYFYRNASFFGAALQPTIQLNGQVVGESKPGGFFYLDRPAGQYEACAATEVERKISFSLEGGETKYIRTKPTFGILVGHINFDLVGAAEAESELEPLHYTGTPPGAPAATPTPVATAK
jgi:hypothetical protein